MEVEFPPLLETKTQFDDFTNVEVLDANRDFCMQLATETEIRGASGVAGVGGGILRCILSILECAHTLQ